MNARPERENEIALADLLDRALHKGVMLWGQATISLAGVDLIFVGLSVVVASVDTVERMRLAKAEAAAEGDKAV